MTSTLLDKLTIPIAKLLLANYLGKPLSIVTDSLVDIAGARIKDEIQKRRAENLFKELALQVVQRVLPLFNEEGKMPPSSQESVLAEICAALEKFVDSKTVVAADLNPSKLYEAVSRMCPLKAGHFSSKESALYDRSLREAMQLVVHLTRQLPQFDETLAAESLSRLSRVSVDLGKVLDGVARIENLIRGPRRQYESDYRIAVYTSQDYLELFGAALSQESKYHSLSVAYVSLNLRDNENSLTMSPELLLSHLRPNSRCILIKGEAGSGKSTLLRWIAIQAASLSIEAIRRRQLIGISVPGISAAGHQLLEENDTDAETNTEGRLSKKEVFVIKAAIEKTEPNIMSDYEEDSSVPPTASKLKHNNKDQRQRSRLEPPRFQWSSKVPFLIRLRSCTSGNLPSLDALCEEYAHQIGSQPTGWVKKLLDDGRALFLFDGLDEVPAEYRHKIYRQITLLMRKYAENYFIITSRPQALKSEWEASVDIRVAEINPMSEADRSAFIDKWHEAVFKESRSNGKPLQGMREIAQKLKLSLSEHPRLAALCANPLLCAMLCAYHKDTNHLPNSIVYLCDALCTSLLERDTLTHMDAWPCQDPYRELEPAKRRALVRAIAHHMVKNSMSTICRADAVANIQHQFAILANAPKADPAQTLASLIERSGVLREPAADEIDFIHNTLKSYLAAEVFVEDNDYLLLAKNALDNGWQPTVIFAAATQTKTFASNLLQAMLRMYKHKEKRQLAIMLLRCREVVFYLEDRSVLSEIDSLEKSVLPPCSIEESQSLAECGPDIVKYLGYRPSLSVDQAAACVRTLRLIGTTAARTVLEDYKVDLRTAVVSELLHAIDPLEIAWVQEALLKGQNLPREVSRQITSLAGLGSNQIFQKLNELSLAGVRATDISPLSKLNHLRSLDLDGTPISDISALSSLHELKLLNLDNTSISDVKPLSNLENIEYLYLCNTDVADISVLKHAKRLRRLDIRGTRVSDVSVLMKFQRLESLYYTGAPISQAALNEILRRGL